MQETEVSLPQDFRMRISRDETKKAELTSTRLHHSQILQIEAKMG
jgi:hypothetical protein